MNRNREIALDKLEEIIENLNLNSQITESVETGEPFIIIEEWSELGIIQRELNRVMAPKFFYKHYIDCQPSKSCSSHTVYVAMRPCYPTVKVCC